MSADYYNTNSLFSIEYTKHNSDHSMSNFHYHNSYELYFLEQGYHNILIDDSIYEVNINDVVLCKPNIFHKSLQNQGCTRTCIYFTDRFLHLYFTEMSTKLLLSCFEKEVITLNIEMFSKVKKLMLLLEQEIVTDSNNRIFIYLSDILNILNDNKSTQRAEHISSVHANFAPILSYINQHYNKINNIEELSNKFYISKFHLCHIFKEATGLTLIQYINKIKIQNACNMLTDTDLSILDIAHSCGFNSSMYFCKTFKHAVSVTPSEFRKNHYYNYKVLLSE